MVVGATSAAGILLIATVADGGGLVSSAVKTTSAPTASASPSPTGQAEPAEPVSSTAPAPPTTRHVPEPLPTEAPPAPCIDPISGGPGLQLADPGRTALLVGDSQSGGAAGVPADRTWTQAGLRGAGYDVAFVGAGGTGFVAASSTGAANYPSSLTQGQWLLPCADPALIVVQGGGNDAAEGATDAEVIGGADVVVSTLTRVYPSATILMIGTLARGAAEGGGRRTEVDAVLGTYAANR
ncbi:MAG: lipolytic enzyme, partial [Micrococcaceae bacterium]|nr:lipolytic enzyme [Micrococcaceae bacterium]